MEETYEPSDRLKRALEAWRVAVKAEADLRARLRAAVAADLREARISNSEMAEHVPWTAETVRAIANEYLVPAGRRRQLRGIKAKLEEQR